MKLKIFFTLIFSLLLFVFYFDCKGQAGEWVWLHGSNIPNSTGNYGVQGFSSTLNDPPALYETCEWTDLNGNFWLFGGGYTSVNADLWKYEPIINEWTWMKGTGIPFDTGSYGVQGVPSPSNNPPNRSWGVASWTDLNGNLWMFGGYKTPGLGYLSDLWKYDISTNEWTWVKGPNIPYQPAVFGIQGVPDSANIPQCRWECAAAWTDNTGDLWLFGGYGSANTMWRYNIATNQWAWMKGDTLGGSPVYGIKGVEDPANNPGYRWAHSRWKDNLGMLWLFGGAGAGSNDLWRFNPSTNNWTWMSGSSVSATGHYGTKCFVDTLNVPSGRYETRTTWTDSDGNLWLFGGAYNTPSTVYNDLWKYCVRENLWVWVSGNNNANAIGNWGTIGISSPTNKPNGRMGAVGWKDINGNIYFFGGLTTGGSNHYNDLWKFTIDTTCGICSSTTSVHEINSTNENIKIYPNPTKEKLTIDFNDEIFYKVEFTLFNILGVKVFTALDDNVAREKTIDISKLYNGVYFLEIKTNGKRIMKKIVKE